MANAFQRYTDSPSKREEYLTYKKLSLSREQKSKAGRRKVEAERLHLHLGKGSLEQPYLKVLRSEYLRIWQMMSAQLDEEYKTAGFSAKQLDDFKRNVLQRRVYDDFLRRLNVMKHVELSFKKEYGRGMTPHEQQIYSNALDDSGAEVGAGATSVSAQPPRAFCESVPQVRAQNLRRFWLNDLMEKLESHQQEKSRNLEHAWSSLVGAQIASEVLLERIDATQGLAICRCLNPSMSFELRQRRDLPAKLSALLHCKINRLVFR